MDYGTIRIQKKMKFMENLNHICKGRLTEADTPTIRLGTSPAGLTSAHLHYPPFFTGRMPFLPPNRQCQSTENS